ncbi:hypothetical protein V492_05756 [Pseudogymnoascus sp. VKM F-4246]|nr:hypothetical protein V492_05756 [Pseudogymnoascus sp. VKM F-4246]
MHAKILSAISTLVVLIIAATPALSTPATSRLGIDVRSAPTGDGYYKVSTNNDGSYSTTFTSIADLNITPVEGSVTSTSTPSGTSSLQERDIPDNNLVCAHVHLDTDDTLAAQACLRAAADKEGHWDEGHFAFCRRGTVMAYACPRRPGGADVNGDLINTSQLFVDNGCGWPNSGWNEKGFRNGDGEFYIDLAIGRTYYGGAFCKVDFVGW